MNGGLPVVHSHLLVRRVMKRGVVRDMQNFSVNVFCCIEDISTYSGKGRCSKVAE